MSEQILTDVVKIDKSIPNIEEKLHTIFNAEIIRWAVVSVSETELKICCSYKV